MILQKGEIQKLFQKFSKHQYKVVEFLGCKIDISRKVFIPRPETEYWTKIAISEISKFRYSKHVKVLDIFAGSGCVGIAVLKHTKNTYVDFVDIDPNALEQILINLSLNKISPKRFKIIQSDIFENLKRRKYHFILANPPYVALDRIDEVDKEVLEKEPRLALFGGKEGMDIIEKFLKNVKKYLTRKGVLYMEFDPQQKEKIEIILKKEKFKFQFQKDQFNKLRFLRATL